MHIWSESKVEFIRQLYWAKDMGPDEIATLLGITRSSLEYVFYTYKIPRRSKSQAMLLFYSRHPAARNKPGRPKTNYCIYQDGYRMLWVKDEQTYKFEHRLVMERKLGRKLLSNERVHHLNGIRNDNRPENLMLSSTQADHMVKHHEIMQELRFLHWQNNLLLEEIRELKLALKEQDADTKRTSRMVEGESKTRTAQIPQRASVSPEREEVSDDRTGAETRRYQH